MCLTQGMFGAVTLILNIKYGMFKPNLKHVSWMKIISISPHFRVFFHTLGPAKRAFKLCHRLICGMIIILFHNTVSNPTNFVQRHMWGSQSKNIKGVVEMLQKWLSNVLVRKVGFKVLRSVDRKDCETFRIQHQKMKKYIWLYLIKGWWDVSIVQLTLY